MISAGECLGRCKVGVGVFVVKQRFGYDARESFI